MPRSATCTNTDEASAPADTRTSPPAGEYLSALVSSSLTMVVTLLRSPRAHGTKSGASSTGGRAFSGRGAAWIAAVSAARRSNGARSIATPSDPDRSASSSRSTSPASCSVRSRMACTAVSRASSSSTSQRLASVSAYPFTTVSGVRSSWLVVARNRSRPSSSIRGAVMSRNVTTRWPAWLSGEQRTSIHRPHASWVSSTWPGSGTPNGTGRPSASTGVRAVSWCAAGFQARTRPPSSSTARPSGTAAVTALNWSGITSGRSSASEPAAAPRYSNRARAGSLSSASGSA
jgi:hypothetical protein